MKSISIFSLLLLLLAATSCYKPVLNKPLSVPYSIGITSYSKSDTLKINYNKVMGYLNSKDCFLGIKMVEAITAGAADEEMKPFMKRETNKIMPYELDELDLEAGFTFTYGAARYETQGGEEIVVVGEYTYEK